MLIEGQRRLRGYGIGKAHILPASSSTLKRESGRSGIPIGLTIFLKHEGKSTNPPNYIPELCPELIHHGITMHSRECFGGIGKADRNNEPVLRELIIAPMYLEGRNPLRPPIRAHQRHRISGGAKGLAPSNFVRSHSRFRFISQNLILS